MTIVIPRKPALQNSSARDVDGDAQGVGSASRQLSSKAIHDELLLRKERALQKKQFRKRIVWDIGVWALLFASVALVMFTICGFAGGAFVIDMYVLSRKTLIVARLDLWKDSILEGMKQFVLHSVVFYLTCAYIVIVSA